MGKSKVRELGGVRVSPKLETLLRCLVAIFLVFLTGCASAPGTGEDENVGSESQATTQQNACFTASVAGECRYAPIKAYASSLECAGSTFDPNNAIDGNCQSRWSSAFSDPQWLKVDLGATRPVSRLVIHWEAAASSKYEIQVSNDAGTWTKVATNTNAVITGTGNNRVDTISGLTGSGRYVRIYSTQRSTSYGNSVFELEVFGTDCGAPAGCSQIPVIPASASASSMESSSLGPDKAIDALGSTRWSSAATDAQWLQLDLGKSTALTRVSIDWENATSAKYELQTSESPTGPWTTVHVHQDSRTGPRTDDVTGLVANGRYLRINSTKRTTQYGISIFELRLYRQSCNGCEQLLVPSSSAASSTESTSYPASSAVDGNYSTRWSSAFSDPQWLRLDFGQDRRINQLIIKWESAASKSYRIEGSASSSGPWTTLADRANQPAGPRTDTVNIGANARYLRIYSTARTTSYGVSIVEATVLGNAASACSGFGTCVASNSPGQTDCLCDSRHAGSDCHLSNVPDSDGDGSTDIDDLCPLDPNKVDPLICGCGVSEVDTDGDKVPDCVDFCPADPNNSVATPCGCSDQNNLLPAGSACIVEACSGSKQEATCNGSGTCGTPSCNPQPNGCYFRIFKNHGYWFCDGAVSWQQAETFCNAQPGRSLAKVDGRIENVWLSRVLTTDTWLGGNDLTTAKKWAWSYEGKRNQVLFLDNGVVSPTGYNQFQTGAPTAGHCLKLLDNGKWLDAACSETHGFVCEQPVLNLAPPLPPTCARDFFPGVGGDCDHTPDTTGPCVDGSTVFPHTAGNKDTDKNNPDFVKVQEQAANCADPTKCANENDPNCATNCTGFASVPPPGGCFDFDGTQKAYCELESWTNETCSVQNPTCTTPNTQCGKRYECAVLDAAFEPVHCDATHACATGYCQTRLSICIDPSVKTKCQVKKPGTDECVGVCFGSFACGTVNKECAAHDDGQLLDRCSETQICPDPGTVNLNTNPLTDPASNLKEQTFPANTIFPPISDRAPVPFPDAKPPNCGEPPQQKCSYDARSVTGPHPWCQFKVDQTQALPLKKVSDADPAFGDKQGKGGSSGPISFDFDPNLDIGYSIDKPLPLGDAEFGAHAKASATAAAHFGLFGIHGDVSILDALGSLNLDRCGVDADARLKLFGYDFLPALLGQNVIDKLHALDTPDDVRKQCTDALDEIQKAVNKAQKALRDAQELVRQQKLLFSQGKRFTPDLCQKLLEAVGSRGVPSDFPAPGVPFPGCAAVNWTPEQTINAFIGYYQAQVTSLITEQARLLPKSIPSFPTLRVDFLEKVDAGGHVDDARRETQQIANINFAIGPIPMNLTIEAYVQYGMAGFMEFSLTPAAIVTAYTSNGTEQIAGVNATLTPFAGAGVSMFLGVGFDFGPLSAKVGIEGEVSLGQVALPIYAGAGIGVRAIDDESPLPNDLNGMLTPSGDMLFPKGKAKKFRFDASYNFGVSADITDILNGSISGKLRIKFFWFSKSWQKQVASFSSGIPAQHIQLIHGEGSISAATPAVPLGFVHMPTPFVDLAMLAPPPALSPPPVANDTRYANFDDSRVDHLFFAGYCECNDGTKGACGNNLDCCSDKTCIGNDFSRDKFCKRCAETRAPGAVGGDFCKTKADCCYQAPSSVCAPVNQNGSKYCRACTNFSELIVDPSGSADECCPGLRAFKPYLAGAPNDRGPAICAPSCQPQQQPCLDVSECCAVNDPDYTTICTAAHICSATPNVK